jgi:hypothetical protein
MSAAGRYSVVDELVNANPVILMGEGELIKQPDQEGVPDEPGRVQFELRYAPMAKDIPHGQTIELGFRATRKESLANPSASPRASREHRRSSRNSLARHG